LRSPESRAHIATDIIMTSYQNSVPGSQSDSKQASPEIGKHQQGRSGIQFGAAVGLALLLFVALLNASSTSGYSGAMRGSQLQEATLLQQPAAVGKPPIDTSDEPNPDYNGEGRYDWQKCKQSNDPDCWKNEGTRVGSYWQDFGLRMKTFWTNFRQRMHEMFTGKDESTAAEETTTKPPEETITNPPKKKHHEKSSSNAGIPADSITEVVAP
jgi:hypothetical protein